jgi:hypothetical protein
MASCPPDEACVPGGSSRRMPPIGPWRLLELRSGGAYGQDCCAACRTPIFRVSTRLGCGITRQGPFPTSYMEWIEGHSLYAWAHGRVLRFLRSKGGPDHV